MGYVCACAVCVWVYIATVAYSLHIVAHFVNVCIVLFPIYCNSFRTFADR